MMRDTGKIFRGARGFSSPFPVQQFSKTRFSVATRLPPCGYFAENAVSKTSAKGVLLKTGLVETITVRLYTTDLI